MKKALVFFILMMGQRALADVTSTVGPSGSFPNLKSAFTAINNGTLSGAVRLEITGSFTEPDSAVLNASGSGGANYSSVLVYPTGPGYIIHGNVDKSLIRLDGADHVTIDGRVNQSGQRDLVIENESTTGRCIFLYNSASFNIIRYCIIKGANIDKTGGLIALGTSKFIDGNNDNVIEQCDIGPLGINYPNTAICALSLTGKYNRNLTISNNEIHDFHPSSISDVSYGIFLNPGITSSIISGNSFYQTSTYSSLANKATIVISITDDINHMIVGNYIGGNAPMCSGTWVVSTPAVNYKFIGISVTGFGEFSIIKNSIKNFFWQTSNTNQSEGSWCGILVSGSCSATIGGPGEGNVIGGDGEGSVTVKAYGNNGFVTGIMENTSGGSEGDITIAENTVGSIKVTGNTASISTTIRGICAAGTYGTKTITNNLIGSLTQPNSIWSANPSTSSANQSVYGIHCTGDVLHMVSGNTISNLANSYAGISGTSHTRGIFVCVGPNIATGNTISHVTTTNPNSSPDEDAALIGIACQSSTKDQIISGNTITNLVNSNGTAATLVIGIYLSDVTGGNNSIHNNSVSTLSLLTTNTGGSVTGIKTNGVIAPVYNNVVRLGKDSSGASMATGFQVTGIFNSNISNNCYFNTVLIEGENVSGSSPSIAFHDNSPGGQCRNNLFINTRSNSITGTGKHYCFYSEGTPVASDYNNFFIQGTGTILGSDGSADFITLSDWQNATGQDTSSFSEEITFVPGNEMQPEPGFYLPGEIVPGISTDRIGNSRADGPDIGAWEGNEIHWTGTQSNEWSDPLNWDRGIVPSPAKNAVLRDWPATPSTWPRIDNAPSSPATCRDLVIGQNARLIIPEGKALTVSGKLYNLTNDPSALSLLSSGAGQCSLIFGNGAPAGSIFQYVEGWTDDAHGWHFLSSPVLNQPIRPGFVPADPVGNAQDFYKWDEVMDQWINSRDPDGTWNSGFEDNFSTGKGYLIAYQNTSTLEFSGILNCASWAVTGLTRTEPSTHTGWHLLGNPFSSPLAWNNGSWNLADASGVAKIWNEANASYTDIPAGGIIPASQGFMVEALVNGASLTIPASARVHSAQPWYKNTGDPVIRLSVSDPVHSTSQESVLVFNQMATNNFDAVLDGHFLAGHAPGFYSKMEGEKLSTNALPATGSDLSVPFCFSPSEDGEFILRADEITNIAGPVTLVDLHENRNQDLKVNPVYPFHAVMGDEIERFQVTFAPVGIESHADETLVARLAGTTLLIEHPANGMVEVIDLAGRTVVSEHMTDCYIFRKELDLPAGVYLVRVTTNIWTRCCKIMVYNR